MSENSFKLSLFNEFARIAKAMANPARLELLEFLAQGERSVEDLANVARLSLANASQHLKRLRQVGLVTTRAEGHRVLYSLSDVQVIGAMNCIRQVAERSLAEVNELIQTYLKVKDALEPVTPDELMVRVKKGLVTVIDVRPPEEFVAGHLPWAINIPLSELDARLDMIPRLKEVIAYCRGPYCIMAYEAVSELRRKGYKARRLKDGFPEWKLSGLPVERSSRTR